MIWRKFTRAAIAQRKRATHWARQAFSSTELQNKVPQVLPRAGRDGKIALVAMMKDEADYVGEWIEFYLLQGVSKVIIYDNGSTDATADIVARFASTHDCVVVPWRHFTCKDGIKPSTQTLAYGHALSNYGPDFRWMLFVDVDEFLFPRNGERLVDAMRDFEHLPSVSVPWTNFGPNGHVNKPSGLVIENYTECVPQPVSLRQSSLLRYKSIVDPSRVAGMGVHFFPLIGEEDVFINERGESCSVMDARNLRYAVTDKLQLNHYFTRSLEEIERRRSKGRASRNGANVENYLERRLKAYSLATSRDDKILQFLPALKRQIAQRQQARADQDTPLGADERKMLM